MGSLGQSATVGTLQAGDDWKKLFDTLMRRRRQMPHRVAAIVMSQSRL